MINLFIVDYYDLLKQNGLSTYITQLSKALSVNPDINVNYILFNSEKDFKGLTHVQSEKGKSIIYIPFDIGAKTKSELEENAACFIKNAVGDLKNIIFHFNWINQCAFSRLLKQRIDCITVLTKHCIPWRDNITLNYTAYYSLNKLLFSRNNVRYIHPAIIQELLAYLSMDHIICVTDFARSTLTKLFGIANDRLTKICNGLDTRAIKWKNKIRLKQQYGFRINEKIILYAGAINKRKGVFDLVTAFSKIANESSSVRLIIVGNGDYSGLFEENKMKWARITVTGNLNKKTLYDFYQMADVGVVPSYIEQCSYVAIEMMHFGLPIVAANVDGLKEIVPHDCGLKVKLVLGKKEAHINISDLCNKVQYFLKNERIAKQYAARAKKFALQNFNLKGMTTDTEKVYIKLLEKQQSKVAIWPSEEDKPLVTIVLPCYNAEKYLRECITSVLVQTFTKFELLIVNDGSTDGTFDIIRQFSDKRIISIHNERNEGITNSLNKGIQLARGKYIARIDADDLMHEERLQKQVAFLENNKNKDIVMVGSHHYVIDELGKQIGLKQYPITCNEIKVLAHFQNPFSHPSVMFRSIIFKKIRYTNRYRHAEDYNLWFRILKGHHVANIPEMLTHYRIHKSNISQQSKEEQKKNTAALLSKELDKLGIEHTAADLAVHFAINMGYGRYYFNTREKLVDLENWIMKVLTTLQEKNNFSNKFTREMYNHILVQFCGIY